MWTQECVRELRCFIQMFPFKDPELLMVLDLNPGSGPRSIQMLQHFLSYQNSRWAWSQLFSHTHKHTPLFFYHYEDFQDMCCWV